MPTVLVIDDNASIATALDVLLSLHEIGTVHAASPQEGLATLARTPVDLVIQDMNFAADTTGGEEGRALFAQIRERYPDLPVILLTAWTHLDMAVELVKAGAADYLAKPWSDERLVTTVRNLLELGEANRELRNRTQRDAKRRDWRNYNASRHAPQFDPCNDHSRCTRGETAISARKNARECRVHRRSSSRKCRRPESAGQRGGPSFQMLSHTVWRRRIPERH